MKVSDCCVLVLAVAVVVLARAPCSGTTHRVGHVGNQSLQLRFYDATLSNQDGGRYESE